MTHRTWRRLWDLVTEPKVISIMMTVVYSLAAASGIILLNSPALTGWWDVMAVMLIIGGLLSALGAPFGHWWVERSGIILVATSQLMRLVIVLDYAAADKVAALWSILAALALMVSRWVHIRSLPRDPRRT